MATGQSFTSAREQAILNLYLRGTTITAPAALWMGLFGAIVPPRSTAVTTAQWFISPSTSVGMKTRMFKVTTNGTTAASAGTLYDAVTDGGTVTDGTAVLTDQTMVMDAQADAAAWTTSELSGSGYARLSLGLTAFPAASAIGGTTTGSRSQNTAAITFAAATANWVPVAGFFLVDASANGVYVLWSRFTDPVQVNNTQQLQYNASGVTIAQD